MAEQSSATQGKQGSTSTTEKRKPGRPAANADTKKLEARLLNMERCLSKLAHYTGTNRVLDEFGIPRWEVTRESMSKVKG